MATHSHRGTSGLYLFNTSNGKRKWITLEGTMVSNFAVMDQTIYAINLNGDIVGLDLGTGIQVETIKFNHSETDQNINSYLVV